MEAPRIYVDTSVFGGCFDPEFESESRRFFELVRAGRIRALLSEVVLREIETAPPLVRGVLDDLPDHHLERVTTDAETRQLASAYLEWGVLPRHSWNDAEHVAAASKARADAITSWNFRDIVAPERIRGFNETNIRRGYGLIVILPPLGLTRAAEELR